MGWVIANEATLLRGHKTNSLVWEVSAKKKWYLAISLLNNTISPPFLKITEFMKKHGTNVEFEGFQALQMGDGNSEIVKSKILRPIAKK